MLHSQGYISNNPIFEFRKVNFQIQIFTLNNIYELDRESCVINEDEELFQVCCTGLTWAGGQEKAKGTLKLKAIHKGTDRITLFILTIPDMIRIRELLI